MIDAPLARVAPKNAAAAEKMEEKCIANVVEERRSCDLLGGECRNKSGLHRKSISRVRFEASLAINCWSCMVAFA